MKNLKFSLPFMALFTIGLFLTSCSNQSSTKTDKTEEQGKEYTSAYVCPMHCKDSGSEEAGTCPTCGMDYTKNKKHDHDGHQN